MKITRSAIVRQLITDGVVVATLQDVVLAYRELVPTSRAQTLFTYTCNGATKRERTCLLCSFRVSWAGNWARSQSSVKAELTHMEHELKRINRALADEVGQ